MNPDSTWSFPSVDDEEIGSAKGSGCIFGWFAGLSRCRHHIFLGCWAAFLLCGWRQARPPFTNPWNGERKDKIFCRKQGEFTCRGLARDPSKTSLRYCSRPVLEEITVQHFTGTLVFPCLARCTGMFNTVVVKMLLLLIGCYLNLDTDLSISFGLSVTFPLEDLMTVHPRKRLNCFLWICYSKKPPPLYGWRVQNWARAGTQGGGKLDKLNSGGGGACKRWTGYGLSKQ